MAGTDRTAAWIDGRIADRWPRVPRPGLLLIAIAALMLLIDGVLTLALREGDPPFMLTADDARAVITATSDEPGAWLLLGDSVLAGDVMAGQVREWQQHRVIDYLAVEQAPGDDAVKFHQVALDGMLPVDLERVIAELDRVDPGASVPVAIELNMRFFSRHYAKNRECTRPWLCELGGLDGDEASSTQLIIAPLKALAAQVRPWVPILRHKRRLDLDRAVTEASERAIRGDGHGASGRADEGAARIAEHYRQSDLAGKSAQIRALDRVLARLATNGRKAVFFTTPLRDGFVAETMGEAELGGRYAALAERIHDYGATLVQLDHPLFVDDLFLDHCHLGPAGNRLLALNLLHALDLRLARRPDDLEIIRTEGPNETFVSRVDTGYAEGAPWQALFAEPDGLAVRAEPREIVIADTGNHVLRRMRGDLETTELLAGEPGEAGSGDGRPRSARLSSPRKPCFLGESIYFIDGDKRRLRALAAGKVTTIAAAPGNLAAIRCHADRVWLLNAAGLHVYTPGEAKLRKLVFTAEGPKIVGRTFALARDGRIFVVGADNRIFAGKVEERGTRLALAEIFGNHGKEPIPRERKNKFPYNFDLVRFDGINDIAHVERYGGLLVQDVVTPKNPVAGLTENVALRYLDLEERRVYPWIKPEVFGQSYVMYNEPADTLVSGFHQGSMALDQDSASLFYLERARSRLYRIDDGMLGVAKVSHFGANPAKLPLPDRFGARLGRLVQARMQPYLYLGAGWDRRPRRGPYLGLLVGSSKSAYHDIIGEYSIGRRIEHELAAELGYRDHIGFDLIQRTAASASLKLMVETVQEAEDQGLTYDFVFLEVYGLTDQLLAQSKTEAQQIALLGQLATIRRETGMTIVFLDTTSMGARRRDAMRAPPREAVAFFALAQRLGFPVLRPADRLMREHLDHSAWGNQPWSRKRRQHHGSTWGIDLTGTALASMAYPLVVAHTQAKSPRHLDVVGRLMKRWGGEEDGAELLADALVKVDAAALPAIDREVVQVRYDAGHLRVFVDRGRKGVDGEPDAVVLAVLRGLLVDDIYGPLVVRATIQLARFRSYNEYGVGALDAADVEASYSFDRDELEGFVKRRQKRADTEAAKQADGSTGGE